MNKTVILLVILLGFKSYGQHLVGFNDKYEELLKDIIYNELGLLDKDYEKLNIELDYEHLHYQSAGIFRVGLCSGRNITIYMRGVDNLVHFKNVLRHELGHLYGLDHSGDHDDIMYKIVPLKVTYFSKREKELMESVSRHLEFIISECEKEFRYEDEFEPFTIDEPLRVHKPELVKEVKFEFY